MPHDAVRQSSGLRLFADFFQHEVRNLSRGPVSKSNVLHTEQGASRLAGTSYCRRIRDVNKTEKVIFKESCQNIRPKIVHELSENDMVRQNRYLAIKEHRFTEEPEVDGFQRVSMRGASNQQ